MSETQFTFRQSGAGLYRWESTDGRSGIVSYAQSGPSELRESARAERQRAAEANFRADRADALAAWLEAMYPTRSRKGR